MLQFSDTTNYNGIVQQTRFKLGMAQTDTTSYDIKEIAVNANNALDRAVSIILESDGRWQWDDTNWTDAPIGRLNLVSGQQDYPVFTSIPDSGEDYLRITRVEMLDAAGNKVLIHPIDQNGVKGTALDNTFGSGTPCWYDKLGTSLYLYPIPNYSSTLGLKIYFQRAPSYFVSTDTTKKPGIASIFHEYIPLRAAYSYASNRGLSAAVTLLNDVMRMEQEMRSFYTKRNKDEKFVLKRGRTSCSSNSFR